MGRSKFNGAPRRVRPKDKPKATDTQSTAELFAEFCNSVFSGLGRALSPLFWLLPVAMAALYAASMVERSKCMLCPLPEDPEATTSPACESLSSSLWDARSYKAEAYQPFDGRFDGASVFETADITCQSVGVTCRWKSGNFGTLTRFSQVYITEYLQKYADFTCCILWNRIGCPGARHASSWAHTLGIFQIMCPYKSWYLSELHWTACCCRDPRMQQRFGVANRCTFHVGNAHLGALEYNLWSILVRHEMTLSRMRSTRDNLTCKLYTEHSSSMVKNDVLV